MDKKVYYLSLGKSIYSNEVKNYLRKNNVFEKDVMFGENGYYIYELINDIKENKENNSITLQHALIKADLVTLSIEINNMSNEIAYDYIDEYALDLDKLFKLMRQYCKEDIIFVSYYDLPSDILSYLTEKFSRVCAKYDVYFVSDTFKLPLVIDKTVLKG